MFTDFINLQRKLSPPLKFLMSKSESCSSLINVQAESRCQTQQNSGFVSHILYARQSQD